MQIRTPFYLTLHANQRSNNIQYIKFNQFYSKLLNYMVMAVTAQAVNQIEIMRSPSKLLLLFAKGNNHSMTAATRGQ